MEDVKKIEAFLKPGIGSGWGGGDGNGSGSGWGDGDGSGWGAGNGNGSGWGDGSGWGNGSGWDDGSGWGDGNGAGSGSGSGWDDGWGDGIRSIGGETIYTVDATPTIFDKVHNNVAKGRILQRDLTTIPCYIVKQGGTFAHGESLRKAMEELTSKLMDGMSEEERIEAFVKAHPEDKLYPNNDLCEWHHRLTGSCEAGRKAFIADRGLTLDGETTVSGFIALTENAYGGSIIKKLKDYYF